MEQFDTFPIQCRHIEHKHEGVGFRKNNFWQNYSYENLDNFSLIRLLNMHRWCLLNLTSKVQGFHWILLCGGYLISIVYWLFSFLGVKVILNAAQYPPHHVTYAPVKYEAATSKRFWRGYIYNKIHYLTLIYKMLPSTLYIITYAPAKFEVAMPNTLGGDSFTRKHIIWPKVKVIQNVNQCPHILWPMHLEVWNCYVQQFRKRCINMQ